MNKLFRFLVFFYGQVPFSAFSTGHHVIHRGVSRVLIEPAQDPSNEHRVEVASFSHPCLTHICRVYVPPRAYFFVRSVRTNAGGVCVCSRSGETRSDVMATVVCIIPMNPIFLRNVGRRSWPCLHPAQVFIYSHETRFSVLSRLLGMSDSMPCPHFFVMQCF